MAAQLESSDTRNKIENLSGITLQQDGNPYQALVHACNDDRVRIQETYSVHRSTRNQQQREKILSSDFKELIIDPILLRLEHPSIEPGFKDPRHCLVLWARPVEHVVKLVSHIQSLLKQTAPNIWLMPSHRLHMTVLELAHSQTPSETTATITTLRPTIPALTNHTIHKSNRPRLVKPLLSHDLAAVALSFVPAAGEIILSRSPPPAVPDNTTEEGRDDDDDADDRYTYHHLRRDLFTMSEASGADVASRYVVPSAHITIARFLTQDDHASEAQRIAWIRKIDDINHWLENDVWGELGHEFIGEWCVGQERGLEARTGALWYGGGRTIMTGEGF